MIFNIDNIPIFFPYDFIYPEQLKYIKSLLEQIKNPGHILIEMPSGTGKTISLLSCTVSYLIYCKKKNKDIKIVYCTRTIPEIDKTLKELKNLIKFIKKHLDFNFIGLGLSRRENMCINKFALDNGVELTCRKLINKLNNSQCDFYENTDFKIIDGVFDFSDIKKLGEENCFCPYYLVRRLIDICDCIIYPYNYLIDPSIYSIVSEKITENAIVIFDEAHNIDSHCIESLSLEINRNTLESATRAVKTLENKIKIQKEESLRKLNENYLRDKNFLKNNKMKKVSEDILPYYFTPDFYQEEEKKFEYAPGNLRNSNHFISAIKRFIEFLKTKLKTTHLTTETIKSFKNSIFELTLLNSRTMKFCSQRLGILISNLKIEDENITKLKKIAKFASSLGIYSKGFSVIFEPYDSMADVFNPVLRLYCMDSSIAISHIFNKFKNVIITSGTLSPIEMYPKILNFDPSKIIEINATMTRNSICPLIITKGDDQMLLNGNEFFENKNMDDKIITTSFKRRIDPSVVRNYGSLIISLSKIVPDNFVVFFPSYIYMEEIVTLWSEINIIKDILKNKLIFIESPNYNETLLALDNFKKACENGRGAVLFCVARGKVSEGVDFENGYGRAVVIFGIPFMYTESIRLKERLKYLKSEFGIKEYDFLVFDAMRHAAQCLGRVLRKKSDYGLMILADNRFNSENKIKKIPKWIHEKIEGGNTGLSIDMAINISKYFYKEMGQNVESFDDTLLNENDVVKKLQKKEV